MFDNNLNGAVCKLWLLGYNLPSKKISDPLFYTAKPNQLDSLTSFPQIFDCNIVKSEYKIKS